MKELFRIIHCNKAKGYLSSNYSYRYRRVITNWKIGNLIKGDQQWETINW